MSEEKRGTSTDRLAAAYGSGDRSDHVGEAAKNRDRLLAADIPPLTEEERQNLISRIDRFTGMYAGRANSNVGQARMILGMHDEAEQARKRLAKRPGEDTD